MWAIGAIFAELFTLTPIFPGERYLMFCLWLCATVMMARQLNSLMYLINFIHSRTSYLLCWLHLNILWSHVFTFSIYGSGF